MRPAFTLCIVATPILAMAIGCSSGSGSDSSDGGLPPPEDAGSSDSASAIDSGTAGDGSVATDSGAPRDSGTASDTGSRGDASRGDSSVSDASSDTNAADTGNPNVDAGPACFLPGDGSCGPYTYAQITNSNGYNTYVGNQLWGCGTPGSCGPETLTAYNPGLWSTTSTQAAGNTAVLTYPDVQQLFNDWDGTGFNGGGTLTDT